MKSLVLVFKKIETEAKVKYTTFYPSSNAEMIIDEGDIDNVY